MKSLLENADKTLLELSMYNSKERLIWPMSKMRDSETKHFKNQKCTYMFTRISIVISAGSGFGQLETDYEYDGKMLGEGLVNCG